MVQMSPANLSFPDAGYVLDHRPGPAVQPAPAATPPGDALALTWRHPSGMLGLSLINFALRVLTLGVYNFWGKTEVRGRIWSAVRINGEPLAYTGTGRDLFLGFLVAMLYVAVPYGTLLGSQILAGAKSPVTAVVSFVFLIVIYWMVCVASWRARRYRLTRTTWRGIRGDLAGNASVYAWACLWTWIVVVVSLGWAYPWRQTKLQRMLIEATSFGSEPLRFTARSGKLYGPFALMWFGGIAGFAAMVTMMAASGALHSVPGRPQVPTPGTIAIVLSAIAMFYGTLWLAGTWYQARSFNYYAANTRFQDASFGATATARGLLWLGISNTVLALAPVIVLSALAAIVVSLSGLDLPQAIVRMGSFGTRAVIVAALVSFGLLGPLLQARSARYWIGNLQLNGHARLADVQQSPLRRGSRGEGLAQAFDIDVF